MTPAVAVLGAGDPSDLLAGLPPADTAPLRRVGGLLAAAREAIARGAGVPDVLWSVWAGSGLQERWVTASERGGVGGAQADRDLDAVVALVERAARFVEDLPGGTVAGFVARTNAAMNRPSISARWSSTAMPASLRKTRASSLL